MAAWYNSGNWLNLKKQDWIYPFCQLMYTINQWEKMFLLGKHTDSWSICSTLADYVTANGITLEVPMTKWTDKNGDSITDPVPADFDGMLINGPEFVGNLERMLSRIPELWCGSISAHTSLTGGFGEPIPYPGIIPINASYVPWYNEAAFISEGGFGTSMLSLQTFEDFRPFVQAKTILDALEAVGHQVWLLSLMRKNDSDLWRWRQTTIGRIVAFVDSLEESWAQCLVSSYEYPGTTYIRWYGTWSNTEIQRDMETTIFGSLMSGEIEGTYFHARRYAWNTDIAMTVELPDGTIVSAPATPYGSEYDSGWSGYDCGKTWLTVGSDYEWDVLDNTPGACPVATSPYPYFAQITLGSYSLPAGGVNIMTPAIISGTHCPKVFLDISGVSIEHEAP